MKRNVSIQEWLNKITILAVYDSIDIAYFRVLSAFSLNYKNNHQRVDKNKFEKACIDNIYEWVKDMEPLVFPSQKYADNLGSGDNFLKVFEFASKKGKNFDQILPEFDITRKKNRDLLGKTWRYKGKMVSNYIKELMKLTKQYDVNISEIFLIFHIIMDRMRFQWTEGETPTVEIHGMKMYRIFARKDKDFYGTILNFFNDRIKKQEEKIDIDCFNFQDVVSGVESNVCKIAKILPYINVKDIIDPDVIKKNVWCFDNFYNVYLLKDRTDTENKNVFMELYDKIYNLTTEVIWIFIISNVFDYWILEQQAFEGKKSLLYKWYSSYYLREEIKKITTEEELQCCINKRFFWVKIFEKELKKYFKARVPYRLVTKYASVEEDSLMDVNPHYDDLDVEEQEESEDLCFDDDIESCSYDDEEGYVNPNNFDDLRAEINEMFIDLNEESFSESNLESSSDVEIYYKIFPHMNLNKVLVSDYKKTIASDARKYLQRYLFDNYQLSGNPQMVIHYLNRAAKGSFYEVFTKLKDDWCHKNFGFGLKTMNRKIERYNRQQGQNDENKIRNIFAIKKENINIIVEMDEQAKNNMKHKIPGYFSQNELSNIFVKIFKKEGKEVSAKTIKRRLKSLVEEGRIDAPEKKNLGLYYEGKDANRIYKELSLVL